MWRQGQWPATAKGRSFGTMRLIARVALSAIAITLAYPQSTATAEARRPEALTTPAGISVQLVREPSIPLVSMRFTLRGGSMADPPGREGATSLMAALLAEGAGPHTADGFARELAEKGVRISFSTGRDHILGSLDALSTRLDAAAVLLRLALREPRFDADVVARAIRQRIADLELGASDGRRLVLERWYAEAFPGLPYARPVDGMLSTVEAIGRDEIVARHRSLTRYALKVVIVGDIGREAAVALVDRVFGTLPASQLASGSKPAALYPPGQPVHIAKAMPLATAAFGIELPDRSPVGIAAVRVLSHIIGSGDFDSVLMEEIRVKRGLAYGVSTSLVLDDVSALLLGGMSTKPENLAAAIATLREVIETLRREGPDPTRFEAAKSYLLGTRPLDLDGNARRASTLLRAWREGQRLEGLPTGSAEIEQVTLADVTHAARQLLAWDRVRIVSIGAASSVATPR